MLAPVQQTQSGSRPDDKGQSDGSGVANLGGPGAAPAKAPTRNVARTIQRQEPKSAPANDVPTNGSAIEAEGADESGAVLKRIVPKVHLVFEQLAHTLAYEDSLSQTLKDDLFAWGYQKNPRMIAGRHGLQVLVFHARR